MKYNRVCQGFTLVEVAVVLVIVGLLVGSFIGTISSRIETTRYTETRNELDDIKQAILGYAYINGALPCPDTDNDGVIQVGCAGAGTTTGTVPWVTLGLGAGDSWNNRYEYWLDVVPFADLATPFDLDTNAIAGGVVMTRNTDGTALIALASNVVVVVFSRGKNGLGAMGVDGIAKQAIPGTGHSDEAENGDGNSAFVSRPHTSEDDTTDVGTFDDQAVWISEFVLKAKMVEAGKLPN